MNNYAYEYEGKLYLNITNRCSNSCTFCIRNGREGLEGSSLWLNSEPVFKDMEQALNKFDLGNYKEVVFCGFGEPVCNLEVLKQTASYLKQKGIKVRLNTNGQGNMINRRNIVPELKGLIDVISISLNASDSKKYQEKCNSEYGEAAYEAVLEFATECVKAIPKVIMSMVDEGDSAENERCEIICKKCGAAFRLRKKI